MLKPDNDEGWPRYTIILEISGRRRRFTGEGPGPEEVIEDAYFFWTGCTVDWQLTLDGKGDAVFTDVLADPAAFKHITQVPPWTARTERDLGPIDKRDGF